MNKLTTVLLCLLFSTSLSVFACERTLTVASHDAFWPPYVVGLNGQLQGSEVDALNIIFKDSPFCFEVKMLPNSKRAFTELRHGRIDLGWAASYTDKRAQFVHFTDSYRTEVMRVYQNKNNTHTVKNLADIFDQGLTIGANFGSYYGAEFEQYKTTHKSQIEYTSATSKRFEMLNKQRIDFVIEDKLVGAYFSKRANNVAVVPNFKAVNKDDIYLMLSKKTLSVDDVNVINQHILQNKAALKALFE
ncbi:transporter substrate-binding domain-containing protein [Pseudoalteromonas sp. MMG007]|uniref:substrate-binding periplasmic protein n=1 Tax=Pseudoalteromonas sp. MMG007 TaxID=2822684 RepID=UPI001B35CB10|nr:transporter substrate-binding domain-containing protein [Pseudoalteromonas sp. MMG007]MBQ4859181.1 transporter substrate-binding domain-containing protein [Pseudoalteromonas sp. MMG007]